MPSHLSKSAPSKWLDGGVFCLGLAAGWGLFSLTFDKTQVRAGVPSPTAPLVTARPARPPLLPAGVQQWIRDIRQESNPSRQAAAAAALAARLSPEDWPTVLARLNLFSPDIVRHVLEAAISHRWAEADPAGAVHWGLAHDSKLAGTASAVWVGRDEGAACAWFDSLPKSGRELVWENFCPALAKKNPAEGMERMLTMETQPGFSSSGWATEAIARHDPQLMLTMADQTQDPQHRKNFRENAAYELGRRDLPAAIEWAEQQPDAKEMVETVFRQSRIPASTLLTCLSRMTPAQQENLARESWVWWENFKPAEMLAALKQAPATLPKTTIQSMLRRMVPTLVRQNPAAARHLLETEWAGHAESWIPALSYQWNRCDPTAARKWMEQLPAGAVRDKAIASNEPMIANLMRQQQQQDDEKQSPVAAALRTLPKAGEKNQAQLNALAPAERQTLWQQAAALPEAQRAPAQKNMIEFQSRHHPAEAAAWLSQADPSPETVQHSSQLAGNWVLHDAPSAAAWATSLPVGETKTWAIWNLARQWHRMNPSAAGNWLSKIEDESTRALANDAFSGKRPTP